MSTGGSSQLAHTLRTAQRQKRAAGFSTPPGPVAPEIHVGLSLAPGAKVIDLVTGEEGVIIAATITHTLVQPAKSGASEGTPGKTS